MALLQRLGVSGVVAGRNYRFGYRASGDSAALAALCAQHGLHSTVVDLVSDKGAAVVVSSTAVRAALAQGELRRCEDLLGRPHRLVLRCPSAEALLDPAPRMKPFNAVPRRGLYQGTAWVQQEEEAPGGACVCQAAPAALEVDADGGVRVAMLRPDDARALREAAGRAQGEGGALRVSVDL